MNIGLMLSDARGVHELAAQAKQAEQDGFASCWFNHASGADAMTSAVVAAAATTRIELGTGVVPVFLRHPVGMAQQALAVQSAAGGRFTLGIGLSHQPAVENRFGLPWVKPFHYMREYLEVLASLIDTGKAAVSGETFNVHAEVGFKGMAPCPIILAALGPRMLDLAGAHSAGTMTWVTGPKTLASLTIPKITEAAARANRPAPRIVAGLPVAVTDDVAAARETAERLFVRYGQLPSYRAMLDRESAATAADVALVGDEDGVGAQLLHLKEIGVTDFAATIFPVGADHRASSERTWAVLAQLTARL
ncbi:MAG: TIGR03564 family F420-dependent LLM class oxidoreductase [Chloroflexota bacterium]